MGFILPWSLFWRWGSVPPFNLVVNKKASGLFRSLAMESKVFYSCFAANFSAISSRRSKVCFSSGYQDHFFAGYDFFRAIVYDTIPVDNHRQTGSYSAIFFHFLILVLKVPNGATVLTCMNLYTSQTAVLVASSAHFLICGLNNSSSLSESIIA